MALDLVHAIFGKCLTMAIGHRNRITGECSQKYFSACDSLYVSTIYKWDKTCPPLPSINK